MNRITQVGFIASVAFMGLAVEACHAGGARIIIRQRAYTGQHGAASAGLGSTLLTNWLLNEGDMILRNQFGGGNPQPTQTVLPPAATPVVPNSDIAKISARLDALLPTPPAIQNSVKKAPRLDKIGTPVPAPPANAKPPSHYPTN